MRERVFCTSVDMVVFDGDDDFPALSNGRWGSAINGINTVPAKQSIVAFHLTNLRRIIVRQALTSLERVETRSTGLYMYM